MANSKDEIRAAYPIPVYSYRVEIGNETVAFSDVSGLSISHETKTYKESPLDGEPPGPRVMHMPGQLSPPTITLKKGVVRGKSVSALFDWINSIQLNLVEKKDINVRLCDEEGTAVISWTVNNAFPTKLDAPAFSANSNEVAIETMTLTADRISIEEV